MFKPIIEQLPVIIPCLFFRKDTKANNSFQFYSISLLTTLFMTNTDTKKKTTWTIWLTPKSSKTKKSWNISKKSKLRSSACFLPAEWSQKTLKDKCLNSPKVSEVIWQVYNDRMWFIYVL